MLTAIREFFEQHIGGAAAAADPVHALQLATAALLIEVARTDGGVTEAERTSVLRAVHRHFDITPDEAAQLVALAEAEVQQASDLFQFTSLVNRTFSPEQKERVIETMWTAAYADGELSAHEQHVMRKIAGLLYVGESAYIAAKLRARESHGARGPAPSA
jgi:uncharacterized tellurite resistance protein B-like protein